MTINFNGLKNSGHLQIQGTVPGREVLPVSIMRIWTEPNNIGTKHKEKAQELLELFPSEGDVLQISVSDPKGMKLKESFVDVNGNLMRYKDENIPIFQEISKFLTDITKTPNKEVQVDKNFLKSENSLRHVPSEMDLGDEKDKAKFKNLSYNFDSVKAAASQMVESINQNIPKIFGVNN